MFDTWQNSIKMFHDGIILLKGQDVVYMNDRTLSTFNIELLGPQDSKDSKQEDAIK